MNYTILFKEEAELDLLNSIEWYESKQAGLGEQFLQEVNSNIQLIQKSPYLFQVKQRHKRFCPLKQFPFIIIYEIEESTIIVYAIFHTNRNLK